MVELRAVVKGGFDAQPFEDAPFRTGAELGGEALPGILRTRGVVLIVVAADVGHQVHWAEVELQLQEAAGQRGAADALGIGRIVDDLDGRFGHFGRSGTHHAPLVTDAFRYEEMPVQKSVAARHGVVLFLDARLQLHEALVAADGRIVLHPVLEVVVGGVGSERRIAGHGKDVGKVSCDVLPTERIVGTREADDVAVPAPEARERQRMARGKLPLRLGVEVPHAERERGHPAVLVEAFLQEIIFQSEGRPAAGDHHGGLVFHDRRRD